MDPIAALLAPLAALLIGTADPAVPVGRQQMEASAIAGESRSALRAPVDAMIVDEFDWGPVADGLRIPVQHQVRIERSITIRISPRRALRNPDLSELPGEIAPRMVERRMGDCVPVRAIAGVQVGRDNRLLLFLRDQRVVSLGLEKTCRARDFYSGFYVERPSDGQICVERDRLQSRSGANCSLIRMRQLVEE
jgi:hypothetical protein